MKYEDRTVREHPKELEIAGNGRLSKKQLQTIIELASPSTKTIAGVAK